MALLEQSGVPRLKMVVFWARSGIFKADLKPWVHMVLHTILYKLLAARSILAGKKIPQVSPAAGLIKSCTGAATITLPLMSLQGL